MEELDLERIAEMSDEEILYATLDPKTAKLIQIAKKMKEAKDMATKLKLMCEAEILNGSICKHVDGIVLLPKDKQLKVLKALMLRDVLKGLNREVKQAET